MIENREAGLDGLRGFAAVMVFVYHLRWMAGEPALVWLGIDWQQILTRFDSGVCLFFVLSGYLLSGRFWDTAAEGRAPDVGRYFVRRLARILPAYWVMLCVFGLLAPSTYTFWGAVAIVLQTLGLHTFADFTYKGVVPVLWSIGIELQFYVLLPILFWGTRSLARRPAAIPVLIAGCILLLDFGWAYTTVGLTGVMPAKVLPAPTSVVVQESVFFYLKWFGIGILGAWIVRRQLIRRMREIVWDCAFIMAVIAFLAVIAGSREGQWRSVSTFGWPAGCLVCGLLVITCPRSRCARVLFDNRIMQCIGTLSYGIYLWHWPVQQAVFGGTLPGRLGEVGAFWAAGAVAMVVTLLIAGAMYVSVERPAIRWSQRQPGLAAAWRSIMNAAGLGSTLKSCPNTVQPHYVPLANR